MNTIAKKKTDSATRPEGMFKRMRNLIVRCTRSVLLAVLVLTLGCSMFQESLIFPGHGMTQGKDRAKIRPVPDSELVALKTSAGDTITVLFGKPLNVDGSIYSDSNTRPTVIFFYGNAMSLSDCIGFCRTWRKMGANVIGVEYPGYGLSTGKPSEAALYAAADASYDYLLKRGDIDQTKIISAGLSLGTGVAVELATRKPVAAVALFAPYTSMQDMAGVLLPWFPARLILRHHFKNEDKIKSLKMPILIVHGEHDGMIPPEMSKRLERAAVNAKVRTVFVNSDHNDIFEAGRAELDGAMSVLIQQINAAK